MTSLKSISVPSINLLSLSAMEILSSIIDDIHESGIGSNQDNTSGDVIPEESK